jgi:hypothetical protein
MFAVKDRLQGWHDNPFRIPDIPGAAQGEAPRTMLEFCRRALEEMYKFKAVSQLSDVLREWNAKECSEILLE